jgi:glyoxylase I family protein
MAADPSSASSASAPASAPAPAHTPTSTVAAPDPGFAVQHIDHVVLRVQDLEAAIVFYRAALGCTVVRRRDDLGLVHLRLGSSMLDLVAVDGPLGRRGGPAAGAQGRNVDHLCVRIEPFDEATVHAHLEQLGIGHSGAAQTNFGAEGEGPSIYVTDLDGNSIELKGPPQR